MIEDPSIFEDEIVSDGAAEWQAFREAPNEENTVALVRHYMPLVRRIVRQMAVYTPQYMDTDDLMQHAFMGLWKAIDRFDESRGVPFAAYVVPRIRGAVRDALRQQDPLSRTERDSIKKLDQITQDYLMKYHRAPDEDALAAAAGMEVEKLRALLVRAQPWISLEATAEGGNQDGGPLSERLTDYRSPDPRQETMRSELAARFRSAFRQLPSRQQKVLYLYYFEDLTLKEVGAALDLTEARICQLHAGALLALRSILTMGRASVSETSGKEES